MTHDSGRLPAVAPSAAPAIGYVVVAAIALLLVLFAFGMFGGIPDTARGQLLRIGAVLLAAGMLLATYLAWRFRRPGRLPGIAEDGSSYAIEQLGQRRDVLHSAWAWLVLPLVPGVALLYAGAVNTPGIGLTWALAGLVIVGIAFAAVIVVASRKAQRIETEIARLSAGLPPGGAH